MISVANRSTFFYLKFDYMECSDYLFVAYTEMDGKLIHKCFCFCFHPFLRTTLLHNTKYVFFINIQTKCFKHNGGSVEVAFGSRISIIMEELFILS